MRSALVGFFWVPGFLIALCASADAARLHHYKPGHAVVRPGRGLIPASAIPGWAYAPPRSALHYDDTPSYDDPSRFGGQ